MAILEQLIVNGLIAGAIYALIAASFSLVFNIVKFMDLSPGALIVVSAFSTYAFFNWLKLDFFVSALLALGITILAAVLIDELVYKKLRQQKASGFSLLLSSFGVFLFVTGAILLIFGADVKTYGFSVTKGYEFPGFIITGTQIVLIAVSLAMFAFLLLFLYKTKTGKALRAIADDKQVASTLGINVEQKIRNTFIISALLAGVAGILVGLEQNLDHTMGFIISIKGITASVVGGVGSVPAALLGGFLIGLVENIGIWFLPSGYKDAIAFVILIIFLFLKPNGLFGSKTREEVSG